MLIFGVLLVGLAALILIAVLLGGSGEPALLDMGLFDISTSTMGVFLIGAATVLIFVSGLELLRSGLRRSLRRRRELKKAREVVARHDRREDDGAPPEAGTETGSTPAVAAGGSTESADRAGSRPNGTATTAPGTSSAESATAPPSDPETHGSTR